MPTKPPTSGQLRRKAQGLPDASYDDHRGTSAERGYGHRWRKIREHILQRDPWCVECIKVGVVIPAVDVHHINARAKGGTDDPSNLIGLCHECHSRITASGG